jgi:hypothetical protein
MNDNAITSSYTELDSLLDALLDVLARRPERVTWSRPAILLPVLIECACSLRDAGYTVTTGVVRGTAYLVGRYRPDEPDEPEVAA